LIRVIKCSNSQVIFSQEVEMISSNNPQENMVSKIVFLSPLNILGKEDYNCEITLRGANSFKGSGGKTRVEGKNDIIFSFKTSPACTNSTTVGAGQIPQFYYIPHNVNF